MRSDDVSDPGYADLFDLKREVLASALAFAAVFSVLRILTSEVSTSTASVLVWAGAVATWLSVAWYFYHRGNFLGGWILAFAPVFAYALNLIVPLATGPDISVVLIPAFAAAAVSVMIAALSYLAGRGVRVIVSTPTPRR